MSLTTHLSQQAQDLLNLRRLPARLDVRQAACVIGFAEHDIPVLVKGGLLNPLGSPSPNAPKYFCAVEIQELASNKDWLSKATKTIARHWQNKNQRKSATVAAVN